MNTEQPIDTAVQFVEEQIAASENGQSPSAAIILGSGLGGLADRIDADVILPYHAIPGFGTSSAGGHKGQLILGRLESVGVVAMSGRFHRYEGWSADQVGFPVRVMHALGARTLIVSNAAGGVSPKLRVGDLVVIRDHINWIGSPKYLTPVGPDGAASRQFPGALRRHGEIYDPQLSRLAMEIAVKNNFNASLGTYLATLGPNYETRSEYRMMRRLGADVAGMSTVPEAIAAADVKMRVLGISMVSNVANPDRPIRADHKEVLEAGRAAETKMESIVRGVLSQLEG